MTDYVYVLEAATVLSESIDMLGWTVAIGLVVNGAFR